MVVLFIDLNHKDALEAILLMNSDWVQQELGCLVQRRYQGSLGEGVLLTEGQMLKQFQETAVWSSPKVSSHRDGELQSSSKAQLQAPPRSDLTNASQLQF